MGCVSVRFTPFPPTALPHSLPPPSSPTPISSDGATGAISRAVLAVGYPFIGVSRSPGPVFPVGCRWWQLMNVRPPQSSGNMVMIICSLCLGDTLVLTDHFDEVALVCVCVCVCVCMRACVRVRASVCVRVRASVCVRARASSVGTAHASLRRIRRESLSVEPNFFHSSYCAWVLPAVLNSYKESSFCFHLSDIVNLEDKIVSLVLCSDHWCVYTRVWLKSCVLAFTKLSQNPIHQSTEDCRLQLDFT